MQYIYVNVLKKYDIRLFLISFQDNGLRIPEDGYGCHQLNI